MSQSEASSSNLLVVDLDDTLLRTDVLLEQIFVLLKTMPFMAFAVPFWLFRGRPYLKARLAELCPLDPSVLPYRESVLTVAEEHRKNGYEILLASASHESVVNRVAEHLKAFDDVLASRDENLKGARKLQAIREKYGNRRFSYVGDSTSDLPLWLESEKAILVNPTPAITDGLKKAGKAVEILKDAKPTLPLVVKQMRVHQWAKNILIFTPLILAHLYLSPIHWQKTLLAFLAFSLLASCIYVLNDLLDLESDRRHPRKRNRPFASGALSLRASFVMIPALLGGAIAAMASLPWPFIGMAAAYIVLNFAYSFWVKRILVLDVVFLAALYTLRILAGGAAGEIPVSQWLLAFSTFFFFGLALVKRYIEITRTDSTDKIHGRGYHPMDREAVLALGAASSFLSVLILVLYLSSDAVSKLYAHPDRLWLVAPILLYWNSRVWLLAHRDLIHDDPVVFAIKDPGSWLTALFFIGAMLLAV